MFEKEIGEFSKRIRQSNEILIITHSNPDGDAIGSALALRNVLSFIGKNVNTLVPNEFPSFLAWMKGSSDIVVFNQQQGHGKKMIEQADLIICLDFNEPGRVNGIKVHLTGKSEKMILVDHHPDPADFTGILISDTGVSSTAELLYKVMKRIDFMEGAIDSRVAECIFTGIMTDTGCFIHGNMTPGTFRILAELIETGIDKDAIYSKVYDNYSWQRMRLMGYAICEKMKVFDAYNSALISLDKNELERFQYQQGDTEGFVNLPFSVSGVKFCAFFMEKDNKIKISLRSKGKFDVNGFAREHFNGGGHKNAAGGESLDSMENTINTFIELLKHYEKDLR